MIRHIVCFKLNDNCEEKKQEAKSSSFYGRKSRSY